MAAVASTWAAAAPHVSVDRLTRCVSAERGSPRFRGSHSARASGEIRVNLLQIVSRRMARGLMNHAAIVSPEERAEWALPTLETRLINR